MLAQAGRELRWAGMAAAAATGAHPGMQQHAGRPHATGYHLSQWPRAKGPGI